MKFSQSILKEGCLHAVTLRQRQMSYVWKNVSVERSPDHIHRDLWIQNIHRLELYVPVIQTALYPLSLDQKDIIPSVVSVRRLSYHRSLIQRKIPQLGFYQFLIRIYAVGLYAVTLFALMTFVVTYDLQMTSELNVKQRGHRRPVAGCHLSVVTILIRMPGT